MMFPEPHGDRVLRKNLMGRININKPQDYKSKQDWMAEPALDRAECEC